MAAIAELDASLQALLTLKPPGVTKGRIQSITQLAVDNVKSESVIIQKIFAHFKRTPATHKLGVLYAVDSVARQWIERGSAAGQNVKASESTDGTYAAGVNRISELLPTMMSDLIAQAPDDQMEKIGKLVDIWERGSTFPSPMVSDFKLKVANRPKKQPSPELEKPADTTPPTQAAASVANGHTEQRNPPMPAISILQTQPQPQPPAQAAPASTNSTASAPPAGLPQEGLAALANVLPQHALTDPDKTAHYLQVLQQLVTMGVPSGQWGDVIKALDQQSAQTQPPSQHPAPLPIPPQEKRPSPPRARSRSPIRRGSPTYEPYRQRSPPRNPAPDGGAKWVDFDPTLPPNHIKVLSRTLFVGGTTCGESELREVFSRFGNVQSVICQPNKRHAFVKMYTRDESVRAKTEMDATQDQSMLSRARSTKWGVGFGPRECCNYDQGVSVIPIDRLTDADRRWILSADFGGTGGADISHGQVMEEPDIEIGAGVSSKAISLKVNQQQQQQRGRQQHSNRRHNNNNNNNSHNRGQDGRDRSHHGNQHRGPPQGYNPNPFPPYQPEQPMMPPPMQEAPMPMTYPPPMPFNGYPPPGGFSGFPPPGMPPFQMQ
ncbi:MAG: hypothetical protein Q9159_003309 [Coniocarpon cinnabarinum]